MRYHELLEAVESDEDRLKRARDQGFDVDDPHYFGTPNGDFDELDLDRTPDENLAYGRGAYTTRDPEAASGYSKPGASWGNHTDDASPAVYKVYLRVKNPFDLDKVYPYSEAKRIFTHAFTDAELQGIEFWTDLATEAEDFDYMPQEESSDEESDSEIFELEQQIDNVEYMSNEELGIDPEDYDDGEDDTDFISDREEAIESEKKSLQHQLDRMNERDREHFENNKKMVAAGKTAAALGKDIYRALWQNTDGYQDYESESKLFGGETDTIEFKTEANRWLEELGYDGLRHFDRYNPGARGKSHIVTISFHPHQVRSAYAKFDPSKADSPKLSEDS